ncbi:MAG: hypothetical protein ABIR17_09380 [Pseudolysinimonas sp.]|uniref:hypothetical protein n=1 Tax=Pseudolysinimonas sp. TaxID=2680009 RepID=UPI00326367E8
MNQPTSRSMTIRFGAGVMLFAAVILSGCAGTSSPEDAADPASPETTEPATACPNGLVDYVRQFQPDGTEVAEAEPADLTPSAAVAALAEGDCVLTVRGVEAEILYDEWWVFLPGASRDEVDAALVADGFSQSFPVDAPYQYGLAVDAERYWLVHATPVADYVHLSGMDRYFDSATYFVWFSAGSRG